MLRVVLFSSCKKYRFEGGTDQRLADSCLEVELPCRVGPKLIRLADIFRMDDYSLRKLFRSESEELIEEFLIGHMFGFFLNF